MPTSTVPSSPCAVVVGLVRAPSSRSSDAPAFALRRLAVVAIGALLCVVATACELSPFSGDEAQPLDLGPDRGVVRHVVDGDTVELEYDTGDIRRLRAFMPPSIDFEALADDDVFDGRIENLNWPVGRS